MTRTVNREPSSHNCVVDSPALSENRRVSSYIRKRNVRMVTHKCITCVHIHLNGRYVADIIMLLRMRVS